MTKISSKNNVAIIFDLDGTIIHSIPDMHLAVSKTLAEFNLKKISQSKLQDFVGDGMLKLSERVLEFCGGNNLLTDNFYETYRKNYSEIPYKYSTLMPGALDIIQFLHKKKIPMSICTNKRQHVTEKLLQQMNLNKYFQVIIGANDNIPLKPKKDMVEIVISKLNLIDFSFFMVGDTRNDVEAANSAGINSVFVRGGYTNENPEGFKPKFILNQIDELKKILKTF